MSRDPQCIFCKIAGHEIPARVALDDPEVMAFLDINPLSPGHLVVIPKYHCATIDELPVSDAQQLGGALPRLVAAVRSLPGVGGVNVLQNNGSCAGQVVGHVHVHVIPRAEQDGLGYRWNTTEYAPGQADRVLEQLQSIMAAS